MDTNSNGSTQKWNHYYWESVKRAHKLKILKYPLLCLLTLLFAAAFVIRFCINGIFLLGHKIHSAFSNLRIPKFSVRVKAVKHTERSEQPQKSPKKVLTHNYRHAAALVMVVLLAATAILLLQKSSLSTACVPQSSSIINSIAVGKTNTSSSQGAASSSANLQLEITKPTLRADGSYQFSIVVKTDQTASGSSAELKLPDASVAGNSSYVLSGLKPGTNKITIPKQTLTDLLPTTSPKNVMIVDTTSYVMAPDDVYGIEVQLIGQNAGTLTAHSSNEQIAEVIQYSRTYYQVIGHKEGTCEIIFEANGMRASTKITVQADVQAHGNAERVLAAR